MKFATVLIPAVAIVALGSPPLMAQDLETTEVSPPALMPLTPLEGADPDHPWCVERGTRDFVPPPAPSPGRSMVVFFRKSGLIGAATASRVREGNTDYCTIGNGSYFWTEVEPGPHAFSARSEATDTVNLETEPDETYYVKITMSMGVVLYRPNLSPSNKAEFDEAGTKLKRSVY